MSAPTPPPSYVFRCGCGRYQLTPSAPWVAYPGEVHSEQRCGRYLAVHIEAVTGHPALLRVTWPKEVAP